MKISEDRKAFETVFAYNSKPRLGSNWLRLGSNLPIIGGIAGLILFANYYSVKNHYSRVINAQEVLDDKPNDEEAKKIISLTNKINNAFIANIVIGFTPFSPLLLPMQAIATLMKHLH